MIGPRREAPQPGAERPRNDRAVEEADGDAASLDASAAAEVAAVVEVAKGSAAEKPGPQSGEARPGDQEQGRGAQAAGGPESGSDKRAPAETGAQPVDSEGNVPADGGEQQLATVAQGSLPGADPDVGTVVQAARSQGGEAQPSTEQVAPAEVGDAGRGAMLAEPSEAGVDLDLASPSVGDVQDGDAGQPEPQQQGVQGGPQGEIEARLAELNGTVVENPEPVRGPDTEAGAVNGEAEAAMPVPQDEAPVEQQDPTELDGPAKSEAKAGGVEVEQGARPQAPTRQVVDEGAGHGSATETQDAEQLGSPDRGEVREDAQVAVSPSAEEENGREVAPETGRVRQVEGRPNTPNAEAGEKAEARAAASGEQPVAEKAESHARSDQAPSRGRVESSSPQITEHTSEAPQTPRSAEAGQPAEAPEKPVELSGGVEVNSPSLDVQEGVVPERPAQPAAGEARLASEAAAQQPAAQEVAEHREAITEQVVRSARFNLARGTTRFELRLEPPTLGRLGVVLDLKEGALSVSFRVENDAVRELLQSSMPQLRASLSAQGISVEGLDVHSSGHQAGEQQGAGRGPASGGPDSGANVGEGDLPEEAVQPGTGTYSPGGTEVDYWA
jgi:flagellar hook-length control protein FliK